MENPSCPNHGPMKWKEGFAKATGKPYAFWTCPTKLPDGSWCPTKAPKGASAPGHATVPPIVNPYPAPELGMTRGQGERIIQLLEKIAGEGQ